MKSLIVTILLVMIFSLRGFAGEDLLKPRPSSNGFEKDARSVHSSTELLAKLSKNAHLHMRGVSFVVCRYAGAERGHSDSICSRLFQISEDGFISTVNPVERKDILETILFSELEFETEGSQMTDEIKLTFSGDPAREFYKKLSKVYTDYDEGPGYTKESRNGTSIKCFSIQSDTLKKYTCKMSLPRE